MAAVIQSIAKRQPRPEPTDEQLLLAYRQLWRYGWPSTFADAMKSHAYSTAIRAVAAGLNRPAWAGRVAQPSRLPCGPVPPTPTEAELQQYNRPGRSPYSKATGLPAPLGMWPAARPGGYAGPGWVSSKVGKMAAANDRGADE